MLDTGADRALLAPRNANDLGIYDHVAFVGVPTMLMSGVSETISVFIEPALFTFVHTDGREESYAGDVQIAPSNLALPTPSLLGRDLFDNFPSRTTGPKGCSPSRSCRGPGDFATLEAR